jgi:hypothetical protein
LSVSNAGYYRRTGKIFIGIMWFTIFTIIWKVIDGFKEYIRAVHYDVTPHYGKGPKIFEEVLLQNSTEHASLKTKEDRIVYIASLIVLGIALETPLLASLLRKLLNILSNFDLLRNLALIDLSKVALFGSICWLCWLVGLLVISGALLAWRWLLGTVLAFCALIAINEAYVLWLEPLEATSR